MNAIPALGRLAILYLVVLSCPAAQASVRVDDHSLSDWGLSFSGDSLATPVGMTVTDNFYSAASGWTSNPSASPTLTVGGFTFSYNLENDSDSAGDGGYLGPHSGGQNYDGEFLGIGLSGQYLAVAIVTGQRPDNGPERYSPGDLRIVTTAGIFGIEMTGQTYNLSSSGFTQTATSSKDAVGTVVKTTTGDWKLPPFAPNTAVQLLGGAVQGGLDPVTQFYYSGNSVTQQHAFFELLIPLSFFEGATITSVHWAPSCGNDLLDVNTSLRTIHNPEPTSALLALFAGAGGLMLRRRRPAGQ